MKVSVRPLRSRADELMMSPFRRIEVGAMVGARGAIIMVWSEVIQLAKSDVRACRGVQRPTVLRCWAHVNLFKMRVLRRGSPCSTRTASPAACAAPPGACRRRPRCGCAQPKVVPVGLSVSRPAVPVHAGARVCCCVYCTPRSSNLQGSRGEISRGPLFRLSFAVSRISPHFRPVTASVADADCGSFPRRRRRRRRDPARRLAVARQQRGRAVRVRRRRQSAGEPRRGGGR